MAVRRFSSLFVLLGCIFLFSCENDEPTVKNQLIISIPVGYVHESEDLWFFITTDDGELLGVQQGLNDSELTFETAGNVKRFVLHQLNYMTTSDLLYSRFDMNSYADVFPGNYQLKPRSSQSEIGNHILTVNNLPVNYNKGRVSGTASQMSSGSIDGSTFTLESELFEANTNIFCYFSNLTDGNIVPKYKFINNVSVDQTTTVDFSEFTEMNQVNHTFGFQADQVYAYVNAFAGDDHSHAFTLWSDGIDDASSLKLFYPGNLFNEYFIDLKVYKGNDLYEYRKIGAIPSTFKTLNADVSSLVYANNNLTVTSTGSFDYLYTVSSDFWTVEDHAYDLIWNFHMGDAGHQEFKIPGFPSQILNKYPELSQGQINFDFAHMDEYDGIDGYSDYLHSLFQSDEKIYQLYTENLGLGKRF
jgi:hypothetical protein